MSSDKGLGFAGRLPLFVLGVLFLAAAIFFVGGGALLIQRGGSWYYLISGIALLALAWGLFRNKLYVGPLYVAIFAATVAWSFWEAGLEFWPLFTRLFIFFVAGTLLAFALPALRRRAGAPALTGLHAGIGVVMILATGALIAGTFKDRGIYNAAASTATRPVTAETEQKNWMSYGSNPGGERFAALDKINRSNVANLEVAWTFRHGDTPISPTGFGEEDQNTPLQIGNTVYFCSFRNNITAINATTGEKRWNVDMKVKRKGFLRCRGLVYHDASGVLPNPAQAGATKRAGYVAPTYTGSCARRIVVGTLDAELIAMNADTGELCSDFGQNGRVNLRNGLSGPRAASSYTLTSPPTLAGDVLVVGGFVSDNVAQDVSSGVVRAYDVLTGDLRWAWDSGNPAITGASTPEQPYTLGSPNVWAPMSYDPENDLIFAPTGSNATDVWGGNRDENRDRYASSIVALRGSDGRPAWSFQTVHHDLWDNDVPMMPTLTTFPKDGKQVPAVVTGTKAGMIFVLDRLTGKPLTDVQERAAPAGNLRGERYAPTQPVSEGMPQFGGSGTILKEADMWGISPFDQLMCRLDFRTMNTNGFYIPPSTNRQLYFPGHYGGFNWGGVSVDPTGHSLFVNDMRVPLVLQLAEKVEGKSMGERPANQKLEGTPYYIQYRDRFASPLNIPCQKPPFGTISAVDLNTQKLAWSVPAGTVQDAYVMGIRVSLPIPIGMPTIGGSLTTQGGLLFFGATMDYYLRAFDSATGKELWKGRLPVGTQGTPISYISPETGEQFVVISAGGGRYSPDRGDYIVAFKLKK